MNMDKFIRIDRKYDGWGKPKKEIILLNPRNISEVSVRYEIERSKIRRYAVVGMNETGRNICLYDDDVVSLLQQLGQAGIVDKLDSLIDKPDVQPDEDDGIPF